MRDISEAQFQRQVEVLCGYHGALLYHTHNSERSQAGYPDCTIITKSNRLIFAELKSATGRVSKAQQHWLERLTATGALVHIWRPIDLPFINKELSR